MAFAGSWTIRADVCSLFRAHVLGSSNRRLVACRGASRGSFAVMHNSEALAKER